MIEKVWYKTNISLKQKRNSNWMNMPIFKTKMTLLTIGTRNCADQLIGIWIQRLHACTAVIQMEHRPY